jgi:2-methylcitrate dehydratase PrpD
MINLVDREGLTPEMVKRVDSWTHPRRLAHTNRPDPQSPLDAKFSVQYCVARGLMHGKVVMQHFDDTAFRDKDARALMQRIDAAPHPKMTAGSDASYLGAEIRVELKDGRVLSEWVERAQGRGADAPLSAAKLKVKFEGCAAMVLPADRVAALYAALEHFEGLKRVRDFTDLVAARPGAATAAAE